MLSLRAHSEEAVAHWELFEGTSDLASIINVLQKGIHS